MIQAHVIAISNHKGGVAKTTSVVNLGAGLHRCGQKVLLIDIDPQANLTQSLGITQPELTIYEALIDQVEELPLISIQEGFSLIPSSLDLSGAELELSNEAGREYLLREKIETLLDQFDYILIDCPPSLGLLTVNALTAAHEVFIPLQAEFLPTQGLAKLMEVIGKIQKRLNQTLEVGGVFLTQYDRRKILNRDVAESLADYFQDKLFQTKIRNNITLAEAPSQGVDVFRYSPKSPGAQDYADLCQEILRKHQKLGVQKKQKKT